MASTEPPSDTYFFNRDDRASIRLNYQHWFLRQICGYLIHPEILTESPDLRIADIGTGTGIWPIEVSTQLPVSTRIDCFDISPDQFPPQGLMPENLHFHIYDAFAPFPEEHQGIYDIVHVRFMVLVVMDTERVASVLDNLIALLKPGGYLQWLEPDMSSAKAIAPKQSMTMSATEKWATVMHRPAPEIDNSWIPRLNTIFTTHGLSVVVDERHAVPDRYRVFNGQTQLMAFEERNVWMQNAGMVEEAREGREAYRALSGEYREGFSIDMDFVCVVGRKGGKEGLEINLAQLRRQTHSLDAYGGCET